MGRALRLLLLRLQNNDRLVGKWRKKQGGKHDSGHSAPPKRGSRVCAVAVVGDEKEKRGVRRAEACVRARGGFFDGTICGGRGGGGEGLAKRSCTDTLHRHVFVVCWGAVVVRSRLAGVRKGVTGSVCAFVG